MSDRGSPTWSALRRAARDELAVAGIDTAAVEARWIVEEVSGTDLAGWAEIARRHPPVRLVGRVEELVARRARGEPVQYVLGRWSFRGIDLMVDPRVLIPRPETEMVVETALAEADRVGVRRGARTGVRAGAVAVPGPSEPAGVLVDLGTGSAAIALALAAELPDARIWATDVDPRALAVARANVAGQAARRVHLAEGSWFDALPGELRARIDVVVSNPPYVASGEVAALPLEVVAHEPHRALVSGPSGREALDAIVDAAPSWLAPDGVLVCELAPHQAGDVARRAQARGFASVEVRADLTGRPRILVARRSERPRTRR